jgi:hypothetical protein
MAFEEYFDTQILGLELEALATRREAYDDDAPRQVQPARQRHFHRYIARSPKQPRLRFAGVACACLTAEEHLSGCGG